MIYLPLRKWDGGARKRFLSGKYSLFMLLVITALSQAGCQEPFQPLKENTQYPFSIYGYLDASADTQWVRVSPPRTQVDMPPVKPEMKVMLENLQSGETLVMHDSLFTQANGVNFINAWTTGTIESGQTYRLKAERPDGATSKATVTLPEEFPTPRLRRETNFFGEPDTYTLFIEDVEHLAEVQTKWYVRLVAPGYEKKKVFSFSYRNKAEETIQGNYRIFIEPAKEREQIQSQTLLPSAGGEIQVLYKQVFVASAGPEWRDEISSVEDLVYALPEGFSNVEGGLGYLLGIQSKWIPFESCRNENQLLIACPEEEPYW